MAEHRRFPIGFSSGNLILFRGLLILPSSSSVDVDDQAIHVRMGWAFNARIPRRMVANAGPGGPGSASCRSASKTRRESSPPSEPRRGETLPTPPETDEHDTIR